MTDLSSENLRRSGARIFEKADAAQLFTPRRADSHKGTYGYTAVMGGCLEYSGAAKLANLSLSALRSGCGVSRLIVPQNLAQSVLPYLLESTLFTLPEKNGAMAFDEAALDSALSGISALAFGMGAGRGEEQETLLSHILRNYSIRLVIDADGLFALSRLDRSILRNTACVVTVTPHVGEFSRLTGLSAEEILSDPIAAVKAYAADTGAVTLLKGSVTTVTDGDKTLLVTAGCPGMATAGSGDVLSGVLSGLLGYMPCSAETAACGAYICGKAGEAAAREYGAVSMLASDTVSMLPQVIKDLAP